MENSEIQNLYLIRLLTEVDNCYFQHPNTFVTKVVIRLRDVFSHVGVKQEKIELRGNSSFCLLWKIRDMKSTLQYF